MEPGDGQREASPAPGGTMFGTPEMVAGYARSRPPVHPLILGRVWDRLGRPTPVARVLDLGCGAGLSTAPLLARSTWCLGIDPVEAMVQAGPAVAPGARLTAARAEQLPIRTGSIDVVTAAGSLNYADLDRSFAEARRVLRRDGALVVYDFSVGRTFPDSDELDRWFADFIEQFPRESGASHSLDPQSVVASATEFQPVGSEPVDVSLELDADSYCDYVMTETNVAQAIRRGDAADAVRAWCESTLADVFADRAHEVVFRGYWVHLIPAGGLIS